MSTSAAAADGVQPSVLGEAVSACRREFAMVVLFSLAINVLLLTAPIYMLQIYDRVIVSRSTDTLVYLTLIALFALAIMAVLDAVRTYVMVRLSSWLEERLSGDVLKSSVRTALQAGTEPSIHGLRDLATVRGFLTGPGILPILDAPWCPIFLVVIFAFHPLLGWLALGGVVVLFGLALASEMVTRQPLAAAGKSSRRAYGRAESAVRNASVVAAMGMLSNVVERYSAASAKMLDLQASASTRAGLIAAASKALRQALQIAVLGVGAWLVLGHEITAGTMIAASILVARALSPVEMAIGSWRSAIGAREAYRRVAKQLAPFATPAAAIALPTPLGRIRVDNLTFYFPGTTEPAIRGVTFRLEPGEALGLIGSTAAGKTTLAGLLVGNLVPRFGHVRLDGAEMAAWDAEDRGQHVGYLPQDIELFAGTIADNIARMGKDQDEAVLAAARLAGVHEMILGLPKGYETEIGDGGTAISGGQRQRIALARALFGSPRLVVLDEPNSNLDSEGERALSAALAALKSGRVTVVVIAHRPSILRHVDKVLVMRAGAVELFGPRDEVLHRFMRQDPPVAAVGE